MLRVHNPQPLVHDYTTPVEPPPADFDISDLYYFQNFVSTLVASSGSSQAPPVQGITSPYNTTNGEFRVTNIFCTTN